LNMKLGFASILLFLLAPGVQAAVYTVTTSADSGPGSLRQAITSSNAACAADTINFNIPGAAAGTAAVITLTTTLPPITCAGVTLDGTTQPDTNTGSIIPASSQVGTQATSFTQIPRPDVAIVSTTLNTGHGAQANGISIAANNVTVQGLSLRGFDNGIETEGDFTGITLRNNYIGVLESAASVVAGDPGAGTVAWSGLRNNNGIRIPKIGATTGSALVGVVVTGNIIAWPNGRGVFIDGASGENGTFLNGYTCCQGNGQGFNLTISNNWIEYTGQQQGLGGGAAIGFEATSGGGIELEDTSQPAFTITDNHIFGQPGRVPTALSAAAPGSNGIEINNAQRSGFPNQALDGGACSTCLISGNTVAYYLYGVVSRAGSGPLATPFSSSAVLDGYTLRNNILGGNTVGAGSAGNSVVIDSNLATHNFSAGLFVTGADTRVTANTATYNPVGIAIGDPIAYLGTRTNSAIGDIVQGNTVTDNTAIAAGLGNAGVAVMHSSTRVVITQNAISRNNGLGIDLIPGDSSALVPGVTANDDGDTDTGPNNLQNFPVFNHNNGIVISGGTITFTGWARPGNTLEFFIVDPDNADPTGFGEGLQYVCSANSGSTSGSGQPFNPNAPYPGAGIEGQDSSAVSFTVSCAVPAWLPANPVFTATATDVGQNVTSEFSFKHAATILSVAPKPVPALGVRMLALLSMLMLVPGALIAFRHWSGA